MQQASSWRECADLAHRMIRSNNRRGGLFMMMMRGSKYLHAQSGGRRPLSGSSRIHEGMLLTDRAVISIR